MTRPHVVTLCGSMRFFDRMLEIAGDLTLNGEIVLAPFVAIKPEEQPTSREKAVLDRLHFRKIDISDSIFVVNIDGYVGESTQREIGYARSHDKTVRSLVGLDSTRWTRGVCARCGTVRKVRADGTIPRHYPFNGGADFLPGESRCPEHGDDCEHVVCPGSLRAPEWRVP